MKIAIAGAGGFIGGWLALELISRGHDVVCVDIKPMENWYQVHEEADNRVLDLSKFEKLPCPS